MEFEISPLINSKTNIISVAINLKEKEKKGGKKECPTVPGLFIANHKVYFCRTYSKLLECGTVL